MPIMKRLFSLAKNKKIVNFIGANFSLGQRKLGVSNGPAALRNFGIIDLIQKVQKKTIKKSKDGAPRH